MRLKYFLVPVVVAAVLCIAYVVHSQNRALAIRPFVVLGVMSSPKENRVGLETTNFGYVVRQDGSFTYLWFAEAGGKEWVERDVHDFSTMTLTNIDEITESIATRAIPHHDLKKWRLVETGRCEGSPAGKILGLDVTYTEETYQMTGQQNQTINVIEKRWLAPDLACSVLQKETLWNKQSDGTLLVDTKLTPLSVTFKNVDDLFVVPASYQERKPGEVLRLRAQRFPDLFHLPRDTSAIDSVYENAHSALADRDKP